MSLAKQLKTQLDKLFVARTYELRKSLGIRKRGKAPAFNKTVVKKATDNIEDLASRSAVKAHARKFLQETTLRQWHVKRGKGWTWKARKKAFNEWFPDKCGFQNYIYVFWKGKQCIYVGQSTQGKTRPTGHFEKRWFTPVTRIDVRKVNRRSEVSKAECLAIHLYEPKHNLNRPGHKKWTRKCPVCDLHKMVRSEMQRIFPIRRARRKK